ncbi:alpha glucosidase [Zychaea mexicana]|uniref:alpha glucosidase n=1 Tax=Zychaea mexicana TaxID=64656 RepID=UPI0022FF2023|nr:alpha glucosidase [Zychaea mexicana]KAI9495162.1 alpha glucosidase [Zychaea mexicana]
MKRKSIVSLLLGTTAATLCLLVLPASGAVEDVNFDVSTKAPGYSVKGRRGAHKTKTGLEIPLELKHSHHHEGIDLYGKTIKDLVVDVDFETADRIHVKISDKDQKQVPVPDSPLGIERPRLRKSAKKRNYEFKYTEDPFGFQVIRKSDKAVIFDTTDYPLVFEDQYLEITTAVPDDANIYGFGETTIPHFRRDNVKNVTTIFARDAACPFYENIYGHHPFYMEIRDGKAHGSLLLSAHGMDVLTVEGRITWKVIGGVLEFYIFVPDDDKPNSVVQSYTDLIGKPMMVSRWMLGWHHCRWGYEDIDQVQGVIDGYKEHNIPLEVAWVDIDYMDTFQDFTFDPVNFPQERMIQLGHDLHANRQRYVIMVNAGKHYKSGYEGYEYGHDLDIFMKNPDGEEYVGQVWPGYTVYPDWFNPDVSKYWNKLIADWVELTGIDGTWVDMDEPAAFCLGSCGTGKKDQAPPSLEPWTLPQETQDQMYAEEEIAIKNLSNYVQDSRDLLYPNYAINNGHGNLSVKTGSMIAYHHGDIPHYDLHSLYGHAECKLTRDALIEHNKTTRPFILTRSSFVGSGRYAGHWTGDNASKWEYLKSSITEIFNMQMFGISYSGSDVCGFNDNTTETLCTRWQELGAFYPFARNHNAKQPIAQEPFLWETAAEATRTALAIRYALLPYYYTLFEESNRLGTGVWRPLIFEWPHVDAFLDNDDQILVGSDILLSPVVYENKTSVEAEFPPGIWYDWYTLETVDDQGATGKERAITLDAPLTHIPVHIRGGAILPLKTPTMLVEETFDSPYILLVALDDSGEAQGRLYIDDGHSLEPSETSDITFTFKNGVLKAEGDFGYSKPEKLDTIKIVGDIDATTASITDCSTPADNLELVKEDNAIVLQNAGIDLTASFTVRFE